MPIWLFRNFHHWRVVWTITLIANRLRYFKRFDLLKRPVTDSVKKMKWQKLRRQKKTLDTSSAKKNVNKKDLEYTEHQWQWQGGPDPMRDPSAASAPTENLFWQPRISFRKENPGLITIPILFSWPFAIMDRCETVCLCKLTVKVLSY